MHLTALIFLAGIFLIWFLNEARKHRPRSTAELARHRQYVQGLYEAGQVTQAEMQQMILLGTSKPPIRYSNNSGGLVPSRDADGGYAQELGSDNAAFWEQMAEQRRLEGVRRREDEVEQHWLDEENHRRDEARQREDEYWAQRQRGDY